MAEFYADPLGWVLCAFPWGEPGPLEHYAGPDTWQREYLTWLGAQITERGFDGHTAVKPIRSAVSSGHGIGKSVLVAWLTLWIMSTRPHCRLTLTANTTRQLATKTWPALVEWHGRCLTRNWFEVNESVLYRKGAKKTWFAQAQSPDDDNVDAFQGQHAASSTSAYLCDEASGLGAAIMDAIEGGVTDGEPMVFLFGNMTRTTGPFYEAVFGAQRDRWAPRVVDTRTAAFPNQAEIAEWVQLYGEDSDFVRVRVRGLAPNASDAQFIARDTVSAAQRRTVQVLPDEPLVAGCDLAWGGSDDNVIRFRRGGDARSIPPVRIKGEFTRDPSVLTNRLADILTQRYDGRRVQMLFLDSAGIAGPIARRLRDMGHRNIMEVNFGADSPDPKYAYMRDYIWGQMKEWLPTGAIDAPTASATDDQAQLVTDLLAPGLVPDLRQRVKLESKEQMKKRGVDSPDDADALALTFAHKVGPVSTSRPVYRPTGRYQ